MEIRVCVKTWINREPLGSPDLTSYHPWLDIECVRYARRRAREWNNGVAKTAYIEFSSNRSGEILRTDKLRTSIAHGETWKTSKTPDHKIGINPRDFRFRRK